MRTGMLLIGALASCQAADDVTRTVTDGGTWDLVLRAAPDGPGETELQLDVTPAGGQVEDVTITMADMGHTSDATVEDQGGGAFSVAADFSMSGWWVMDGNVTDGGTTEAFRLAFEVP